MGILKRHSGIRHGTNRFSIPNARGVTIIDTLLTIGIFTIIAIILMGLFLDLLRFYTLYDTRSTLVLTASKVSQRVSYFANLAFGIETNHIIDTTTYTTGADTVVLKLAAIDANGDAVPSVFDYIIIASDPADATHLLEITDADPTSSRTDTTRLLGDTIDDFVFAFRDANPVTSNELFFSVTTAATVRGSFISHTLHTYAKLRNIPAS